MQHLKHCKRTTYCITGQERAILYSGSGVGRARDIPYYFQAKILFKKFSGRVNASP